MQSYIDAANAMPIENLESKILVEVPNSRVQALQTLTQSCETINNVMQLLYNTFNEFAEVKIERKILELNFPKAFPELDLWVSKALLTAREMT